MKNVIPTLLTALLPAIKTATGKDAYSRMPKEAGITYPYIYISDKYQREIGPKTSMQYEVDILIQVVYMNATSLSLLHTDLDAIMGIVNNSVPFALASPYKIMDCTLVSMNDMESETETGTLNIGLVRLLFNIE
jgi:hypothetical protein